MAERIADDLLGEPFRLSDDLRPLYHAAAVFASNYLVAITAVAERLFAAAGVPDPGAAMAPLQQATLDNMRDSARREALTGPAARGDAGTVAAQPRGARAAMRPTPCPRTSPWRAWRWISPSRGIRSIPSAAPRSKRCSPGGADPGRGRPQVAHGRAARRGRRRGAGPDDGRAARGPRALIRRARGERDLVVVSIFVNPLQFGTDEDFVALPARGGARPRAVRAGRRRRGVGADASSRCTRPAWSCRRPTRDRSAARFEGAARPGHFAGVLKAVRRLVDVDGTVRRLLRPEGCPAAVPRPADGQGT